MALLHSNLPLPLLSPLVRIPALASLLLRTYENSPQGFSQARVLALRASLLTMVLSLLPWLAFDGSTASYQFMETYSWAPLQNLTLTLGVDGLSLFFLVLNCFLIPLCLLASWNLPHHGHAFMACFLALEALVNAVFLVTDVLLFYVAFEAVLVPMFLLIGIWGSRQRKVRAAYFFFLYTLAGSLLMLMARALLYWEVGCRDMTLLAHHSLSPSRERLLWLAFFASFAVKVPMLPLHIWLPEAHVEAPTAASVILAGILLKLGTYGRRRLSLPLFPQATIYFTPLVYMLAALAIIYTSLTAIRQSDMKRVIAYASVAHMNVTLLGLFSLTVPGVEGAILQMLSHGLVAGALFLCVGVLYDRHHSRLIAYYGGLASTMPIFASLFLFFTMANIALPGTSSFVGEFLILLGAFSSNTFAAFAGSRGMILGGAYSLWLYNRLAYGNRKTEYLSYSSDLTRREVVLLAPLVFFTLFMGIYPEIFLDPMHCSVRNLLEGMRLGTR